jgi:hypothetical protein
MLGRWAICPHCGGEIDWRELTTVGERTRPNDSPSHEHFEENDDEHGY